MSIFLTIAFLFYIGSLAGWGIEVLFRKFFSRSNPEHKWINPGFLTGPYLPLYGFSLCALYLLSGIEPYIPFTQPVISKLCLFLLMSLCVTGIEYIAGIIFIKGMHLKLWDYSGLPGNIQGIICPLFSFFWAVLSAIYYFLIHPYILNALHWLSKNLAFSFCIGFFFGVFTIDLIYTANLSAKARAFAKEHQIVIRYEELKGKIRQYKEDRKEHWRFLFSFSSARPITEHLKEYYNDLKKNRQFFESKLKRKK